MISLPMLGSVSQWLAKQDHQALFVSGMDHTLDLLRRVPDERVDAIILDRNQIPDSSDETLRTLRQAAGRIPLLLLPTKPSPRLEAVLDGLEIGVLPNPLGDTRLEPFIHYTARCFWTKKRNRTEEAQPAVADR